MSPSISSLVAHVRAWVTDPLKCPTAYYRRGLERVPKMSDADLADIVRFARTTRGAEMALVHVLKEI